MDAEYLKSQLDTIPTSIQLDCPPKLIPLRDNFPGIKQMPEDIKEGTPEFLIFNMLIQCYMQKKCIMAGSIEDVAWGFRQAGIPTYVTQDGLQNLKDKGYLFFTDAWERNIESLGIKSLSPKQAYYAWTNKFYGLLSENKEKPIDTVVNQSKVNIDNIDFKG